MWYILMDNTQKHPGEYTKGKKGRKKGKKSLKKGLTKGDDCAKMAKLSRGRPAVEPGSSEP